MGRLLRFGCVTVIILAVVLGIASVLGPSRSGNTPPPQQAIATATEQQSTNTETLDGPLPTPTSTVAPQPQTEQIAASDGRCEKVPPDVVAGIETGLTVADGGTLRGTQAVRSRDFEQVWFVAADLQGAGLEGKSDIAVWAMNDISAPGAGLTIAVNAVAKQFSEWGAADQSGQVYHQ